MRRLVALSLAAVAASCGGGGSEGEVSRPPAKAWGLPGGMAAAGLDEEVRASSDCVLMLVLDGVSRADLERDDLELPNLESLAAGAVRYRDAIAVSTGGNSGLASLLTGRYPPEHGVGSMRTPMFARLSEEERTLAEGFHDLGWRTVASLAEARQSRGISGFAQGFDGFDAPRPGEAARDALGVSIGARDLLAGPLLEPGLGVFGLVVFGAPLEAAKVDPEQLMGAAPLIGERLASVAAERAEVARELQRLDGTAEAAQELVRMLGRARGSDAWELLERAVRDAQLLEIDRAVGRLLEQVEVAGRGEDCTVVLCATRGHLRRPTELTVGRRFATELLEVPLWIRWAHGQGSETPVVVTASVLESSRALDRAFDLGQETSSYPSVGSAYVSNAGLDAHAFVAPDRQEERLGVQSSAQVFDRAGGMSPLEFRPLLQDDPFTAYTSLPELEFWWTGGEEPPAVRWESGAHLALDVQAGGEAPARRGRLTLDPSGRGAAWGRLRLGDRGASLRVSVEPRRRGAKASGALVPDAVLLGGPTLAQGSTLYLEGGGGEAVDPEASQGPRLRLEKERSVWWRARVEGVGPAEVLVGCWPPRDPWEELEVEASAPVRRVEVPGRPDLAKLVGEAPFDFAVRREARERFALSCSMGGSNLAPDRLSVDGEALGGADGFAFRLDHSGMPPRWPGPNVEDLGDGVLYIREREGHPMSPRASEGFTLDQLRFLRTLPLGE